MGPQHAQCGPSPLAAPGCGLDPVPQRGENLVRLLTRIQDSRAGDRGRGAGPHPADVLQGTRLPGAQRNVPGVPTTLVVGVEQQLGQLVYGSAGAGDVAGDGRGDPVPVLGRALPVRPQDHGPGAGAEPAVTARRIAAGEVSEQNQISRSRRQPVKPQSLARVKCPSGWVCLVGVVWHCGVVSQGRGRHPGPLKPRVVSGFDLQSVPGEASRMAVLEAFVCLAPQRRQASPSRLDRDRFGAPPEESWPSDTTPTSADSEPNRGRLPLTGSEQLGSNRGRIRAVSSDCLRSSLQPVLAGHSRYGSPKCRSGGCAGIPGVQPDSSAAPCGFARERTSDPGRRPLPVFRGPAV